MIIDNCAIQTIICKIQIMLNAERLRLNACSRISRCTSDTSSCNLWPAAVFAFGVPRLAFSL